MKNIFIVCFFTLPFFLVAQEQNQEKKVEKQENTVSESLTNSGNGAAFLKTLTSGNIGGSSVTEFDNRYEGVKGSPFFFEEWSLGSVLYDNRLFDKELMYRYDVMQNDLHLKFQSGEIRVPNSMHILQFSLKDKLGKTHFFDHAIIPGERADQFYEVLYAGKQTQLLKLQKKQLRKADYQGAYSSDQRSDEFLTKSVYFLRTTATGNYESVKIKRRSLIAAFPTYEAQLKTLLDGKEYNNFDEVTFAKVLKLMETEWMK